MSDLNVANLLPLVEILTKAGVAAIERREGRKVSTMTLEEVKVAAGRLGASIRPWDEPIAGEAPRPVKNPEVAGTPDDAA